MSEEREISPATSQPSLDPTPDSSVVDLDRPIKREVFDTPPALPMDIYQIGRSVDGAIEGNDLVKLRTFLTEKLTVRQLRKLIDTVEGGPDSAERSLANTVKTPQAPPTHTRRLKRRFKGEVSNDPVPGKRSHLLPANMRFSFCLLCINNFTIETPSVASKEINCVKICSGTRRILYDTNFMLGEDWCSSVISVHFDNIECISIFKEQLVIYLSNPAIVEASYKNGCPSLLGTPNGEIENATHHTIMMRSPHELAGIKTAILSADPKMVHKFTASQMEHHGQEKGVMHPQHGMTEEYVPQQGNFQVNPNPNGHSHYMVPQVAPSSYGPVNANNSFSHQAATYPRQGLEGMHYAGGPFNPGPQPMFKGNPYCHSQYAMQPHEIPPLNASDFSMQAFPPNGMHYVDPSFTQIDRGCVPPQEEQVQDMRRDFNPPMKGIIEMAMLGVDEMDACSEEERTANAAARQQCGAGPSHLGFFDTPML